MTEGRSTAASRTPAKCARWAGAEVPRDSTRGMIINPFAPIALGVGGQRRRALRVLRAGSDDDGKTRLDESGDALHPLLVGQQRPVAHRSAIDHGGHAGFDELASLAHERVEVGRAVGLARRHQSGNHAGEDVRGHGGRSWFRRRGREMRTTRSIAPAASPVLLESLAENRESAQYPRP